MFVNKRGIIVTRTIVRRSFYCSRRNNNRQNRDCTRNVIGRFLGKQRAVVFESMGSAAENARDVTKRKPGVCTDAELLNFLKTNANVIVVDARNPDFTVEADDEMFGAEGKSAPISDCGKSKRPNAVNLPFDREKKELQRFDAFEKKFSEKAIAIVTHCGGGGRGQKAKEFLQSKGYTNVINGGGPSVGSLWKMFGSL
jgi:rhodanese-related sulfurtransferase